MVLIQSRAIALSIHLSQACKVNMIDKLKKKNKYESLRDACS